jgi:hypothetical protein
VAWGRDPISTDRPDVANGSTPVGAGVFQAEVGADVSLSGDGDADAQSLGTPLLLRYGVLSELEARLETGGLQLSRGSAGGESSSDVGFGGVALGGKLRFWEQEGSTPAMGALLMVSLPLQEGESLGLSPTLALDWDWGAWGLGVNVGAEVPITERDTQNDALAYAVSVPFGLDSVKDGLGAYVEAFGGLGLSEFDLGISLGAGLVWVLTPDLQLDWALRGLGFDGISTGVGASVRF